jgi:hypothetical protein
MAAEIERKVREAVGLSAFDIGGDEVPVEVAPDLVVADGPPAKKPANERETTGVPAG